MKKVLLVLGGLLMVASGVSAVSAYEAHLINILVHVENAIMVDVEELDFGTMFPEEWATYDFTVMVSTSFCTADQLRVNRIDYAIWVEWKERPDGTFYPWLGDALYLGVDATDKWPIEAGGDLVKIEPSSLTIKPGETVEVDFRLMMPASATPEKKFSGRVFVLRLPSGVW